MQPDYLITLVSASCAQLNAAWKVLLMIVTRIQQLLSVECVPKTSLGPFMCTRPFISSKNFEI